MGSMNEPGAFRLLAECSPDVIARFDRQCRRIYVNPAFERLYDVRAEAALGRTPAEQPWAASVTPLEARQQQARLQAVIDSGQAASFDLQWTEPDGRKRCFELKAVPELDASGNVVGAMTFAREVTEQRQNLRKLELLNFALDHVAEAMYLIGEDARLLKVNEAGCKALGYARDELLQLRVWDVDPDFPIDRWAGHWQDLCLQRSLTVHTRHRDKWGRVFPVEICANIVEHDGRAYNMALVRDISEQEQARLALQRREQEFRALVESSPDFITRYDRDARLVYANPAFLKQVGEPFEVLNGRVPSQIPWMGRVGPFEVALREVIASGSDRELERDWIARDGRSITTHVRMTPEFDAEGQVASVLVVGRDITERKAYERRLERTERMARIGHWEWDHARRTSLVSPMLCHLFGQPRGWSSTVEETLALMPDEDRRRVQAEYQAAYLNRKPELAYRYRSWTARGELLHFHTHVQIDYDGAGNPVRLCGTTQDVSEIEHYESRLHEMTFQDPLTGLPNRVQLYARLEQAIEDAQRLQSLGGLLLLDLDRFQEVNDTLGHVAGDRLLCDCAERLRGLMGRCDLVARLGGDEFALLVKGVQEAGELVGVAQEVLRVLAQPFRVDGQELYVSTSVGMAVFPSDGRDTTALLQYADAALNDAKTHGRACYRFYSADLTAKSHERVQMEAALRRAISLSQLELHYQPKVALSCREWVGAEALLRWQHPTLGLLTPDRFIGLAEEAGLIVEVGAWVLQEACEAACRWNAGRGSDFKVAVNLSPVQFRRSDVVATVRETLAETGCKPRWLELEITESLLLGDDDGVKQALKALRDLGISIAIDDFGTGYSSLAYLKRFAIDVLKIDRSFTRDIGQDHDSTELVKAIITMARSLRMGLVAEGVEDESHERFLQDHGCLLGQGFFYARAMSRQAFEAAWPERRGLVLEGSCAGHPGSPEQPGCGGCPRTANVSWPVHVLAGDVEARS